MVPAMQATAAFLLIVSIDGLSWDTLQREREHMPHLATLMLQGVAGPAETVFPSLTWPAHTTISTGRSPRHHGVVGNYFLDRKTRERVETWSVSATDQVRAPTLYDLAHRAGLKTAAVLWASTQGSTSLDLNIPEIYAPEEFARWATPSLIAELVRAGIPADRLSRHSKVEGYLLDRIARDITVHVVEKHLPNLLMTHFTSADTFGHKAGPGSPEMRWGLELIDGYLGDVLAAYGRQGLTRRLNVLVVSDHGFSPVRWRFDPNRFFAQKRVRVGAVGNGYALFLYGRRRALDRAVRALKDHPLDIVSEVYEPSQYAHLGLPTPAENERIGDRIVVAKPHAYFKKTTNEEVLEDLVTAGMHGHHPAAPGNRAIIVAAGPSVARSEAPRGMRLVDIAPSAASLLGLRFETPIEGRILGWTRTSGP